eukprot:TRINITY_DN4988_c0_g1_i1.p2 TRINITY_DN4988_c0_g1~~TRINITY_DN4988_c0_g1_i1.p2  ORF type:complete len:102 (-),score=2.48 TRINITY_DN4988_c0_g1_i1:16-321(-)
MFHPGVFRRLHTPYGLNRKSNVLCWGLPLVDPRHPAFLRGLLDSGLRGNDELRVERWIGPEALLGRKHGLVEDSKTVAPGAAREETLDWVLVLIVGSQKVC